MYYLFIIIILLFYILSWAIVRKKFDIKEKGFIYHHVNKIHKIGELIIVVVSLILLGILAFADNTPPLKYHYFIACVILLFIFRTFMEWKIVKSSKRYILSILVGSIYLVLFLGVELVFTNPLPVRLETDQVKEINIEHNSETEDSYIITLKNKELIKPILGTISDGQYQIGTYPITPRLEMIIKLKNGREILIKEFITRTYSGDRAVIFMVHTERIFFPKDMMLYSKELELVFEDFAEHIIDID